MEEISKIIAEYTKNNNWKLVNYLNDEYYTMTIGSYSYNKILNDYNTFMYIKMIMNTYFIKKYSIQETKTNTAHGISIYVQKDEFCKIKYFMNSIV